MADCLSLASSVEDPNFGAQSLDTSSDSFKEIGSLESQLILDREL